MSPAIHFHIVINALDQFHASNNMNKGRGPPKKYVRSEGGGVPKKAYENVQVGRVSSMSVRTPVHV